MTEEQAIERLWRQLDGIIMGDYTLERRELPELCAKAAWNEMKAIAREEASVRVTYGSFVLHEDGSKTWHPNPNLALAAEEQYAHNWPA